MTDKKRNEKKGCFAALGSITGAQKAQRALANAAIPTSVIKSNSGSANRGCVWGVSFSCNQTENVKTVLAASGIYVKAWGTGE